MRSFSLVCPNGAQFPAIVVSMELRACLKHVVNIYRLAKARNKPFPRPFKGEYDTHYAQQKSDGFEHGLLGLTSKTSGAEGVRLGRPVKWAIHCEFSHFFFAQAVINFVRIEVSAAIQ